MIAVIFELWPSSDKVSTYFDLATQLRPTLERMDGFISVERFESLAMKGKYLSLSFWRDEAAVRAWRNLSDHRSAQSQGRGADGHGGVLDDYRLRVAHVQRDYGLHERGEAPLDSQHHHQPLLP
jgi:heme-degrading monooxygenase HmoA